MMVSLDQKCKSFFFLVFNIFYLIGLPAKLGNAFLVVVTA